MKKIGVLLLVSFALVTLFAGCDLIVGMLSTLNGEWSVTMFYDDDDTFEVTAWTLKADNTFVESYDGIDYSGTWSTSGSDFTLHYSDWDNAVCTGKISTDKNTMMGVFESDEYSGSWVASRAGTSLPKSVIGKTLSHHSRK